MTGLNRFESAGRKCKEIQGVEPHTSDLSVGHSTLSAMQLYLRGHRSTLAFNHADSAGRKGKELWGVDAIFLKLRPPRHGRMHEPREVVLRQLVRGTGHHCHADMGIPLSVIAPTRPVHGRFGTGSTQLKTKSTVRI